MNELMEYLIETHMHTSEVSPCGRVGACEGIRTYKELGYGGVVITDHFFDRFFESLSSMSWHDKVDQYLTGYRLAVGEGVRLGVRVFLGMEYCIPGTGDDILIYGFDEQFLYDHENLHLLSADKLCKVARMNGLLLLQAHPFRKYISRVYDEMIEGMEVYNGNRRHDSNNDRAAEYASHKGLISVSGSDFHQMEDAGRGGIYLETLPHDSKELASILRKVRTPRLATAGKTNVESRLSRIIKKLRGKVV